LDRLWVIPLLHERVLQRLQVGKQPRLKLHHGDAIDTGLVGANAHMPPCLGEGLIGINLLIETRVSESQHNLILLSQRLRMRTAYAARAVHGPSTRYGALRRAWRSVAWSRAVKRVRCGTPHHCTRRRPGARPRKRRCTYPRRRPQNGRRMVTLS